MSTYFNLKCVSHDPPVWSGEVGYNERYLPAIRKNIARRDELVGAYKTFDYDVAFDDPYFRATIVFFDSHPKCTLEIEDEYGKTYSLTDDSPTPIDKLTEFLGDRMFTVREGTLCVFDQRSSRFIPITQPELWTLKDLFKAL